MAITAAMVKELREISGAGMMDCKKALTATEGDMDKAMEFLREKMVFAKSAQKKRQSRKSQQRYRNAESCRRFQKTLSL